MLWESSHTGISLKQATNPEIITALVSHTHYPFWKLKHPSLSYPHACRACISQGYCACCCAAERGRGQGQVSKEVTAGWLVLALTCDTDLVPQALLLQLFGVSNAQHKISHAWKCLKLQTLSQHFLNEAPARPPGQQWILQGGRWFNLSFHLFS